MSAEISPFDLEMYHQQSELNRMMFDDFMQTQYMAESSHAFSDLLNRTGDTQGREHLEQ